MDITGYIVLAGSLALGFIITIAIIIAILLLATKAKSKIKAGR